MLSSWDRAGPQRGHLEQNKASWLVTPTPALVCATLLTSPSLHPASSQRLLKFVANGKNLKPLSQTAVTYRESWGNPRLQLPPPKWVGT